MFMSDSIGKEKSGIRYVSKFTERQRISHVSAAQMTQVYHIFTLNMNECAMALI